jgi:hypothetical protein
VELKETGLPRGNSLSLNALGLCYEEQKNHRKAQKHKGDEHETNREESDGCYVCISLIVGDVP